MGMTMFMPMAPITATHMTMGMYTSRITETIITMRMTRLVTTAMSMFMPMALLTAMNMVITMIMQAPTPWSLSKHAFSLRTTPKP